MCTGLGIYLQQPRLLTSSLFCTTLLLIGVCSSYWTQVLETGEYAVRYDMRGIHSPLNGSEIILQGNSSVEWDTNWNGEVEFLSWRRYCMTNFKKELCHGNQNEEYCDGMDAVCGSDPTASLALAIICAILSIAVCLILMRTSMEYRTSALRTAGVLCFIIAILGIVTSIMWKDVSDTFSKVPVHYFNQKYSNSPKITMEQYACKNYDPNCWTMGYAYVLFAFGWGVALLNGFFFLYDSKETPISDLNEVLLSK